MCVCVCVCVYVCMCVWWGGEWEVADYSHCSALDDLADLVQVLPKLLHRRAQHLDLLVRPLPTEKKDQT